MSEKVMQAVMKREQGYNCAQAVFCTYCEEFGIAEPVGYRLSEGLGSGTGGLQEVCGAFQAAVLLIGLANGDGELASKQTRPSTYQKVREASAIFQAQCSHLLCKEIVNDLDDSGKRLVSCGGCVKAGAEIVEKYLKQSPVTDSLR